MVTEKQLERVQSKVVDTSEPWDIQEALLEVGWERRKLTLGDYTFFNHEFKRIGIERKSIEDFSTSIGDRLSGQLEACLDFYDETILLIEGSWENILMNMEFVVSKENRAEWRIVLDSHLDTNKKLVWKEYWNYLRQRQRSGVTIELTTSKEHTVERLNELYALYQKPYSESGKTKRFDDDRILAFPSGCRGQTAENCLNIFGSIELVCKANIEQLLQVPKIGQKKAERIWEHFHKSTPKMSKDDFELFKKEIEGEQGKLI